MPIAVPEVDHAEEAVAVLSCTSACGSVVDPVPPEKCAPDTNSPGVDAAPAAEKVAAPLWVFAPFKRGMVAPLVPVFTVAAEPNATELVFVQVTVSVPDVAQSPDRSPFVTLVAPLNFARLPLAGDPVVVTVPEPEIVLQLKACVEVE